MAVASPVMLSSLPTTVNAVAPATAVPTPEMSDTSAGMKQEPDKPVLASAPAAGETELLLEDDELPMAA